MSLDTNLLDMELQSLGYLCVAEQPLSGVIVLVGYAMPWEVKPMPVESVMA